MIFARGPIVWFIGEVVRFKYHHVVQPKLKDERYRKGMRGKTAL